MRLVKLRILIVVMALMFIGISNASAKNVKILFGMNYANTSVWVMTTKAVYKDVYIKGIYPVLARNNADVITDQKYLDKLKEFGYSDFISVERADLIDLYKNDGFDYIVLADIEPVRKAAPFGFETSAHLKILNMKTNRYEHSGKIYKSTKYGGTGTVSYKLGLDIGNIIDVRVFKNKN